jgi:hypothetical protein
LKFSRIVDGQRWSVVYDKALRDDGTLLFPEKLSGQFLAGQRKLQGSYIFAHQYQNEIIPAEDMDFKPEWLKYYSALPTRKHTFAFIDPAISLEDHACYTAVVVIDVDENDMWYLKVAKRMRITATQTIKLIFDIHRIFKPNHIGIEIVAYQEALMHFLDAEMRRTGVVLPVQGIKRSGEQSKMLRIRSLVPRFEWDRIRIKQGLTDFEDEYSKFPKGSYVDILDALSSLEETAHPIEPEKRGDNVPRPNHPDYEKHYIRQLAEEKSRQAEGLAEEG